MEPYDALRLAATLGGMLAQPELQSNCLRLEALIHLAIASAHGDRKPSTGFIARALGNLGKGPLGLYEDPAEDVFVTTVATPRGNFRVLEGIWESAGFYAQRIINLVESMPRGAGYDDIRDAVYSLLQLSDVVCERAKLVRYQLGSEIPRATLSGALAAAGSSCRRLVKFSTADLERLSISLSHLGEFVFNPRSCANLCDEAIGHTTLERYPVARRRDDVFFVLPTATSAAIRRFVIERMDAAGMRQTFLAALADEYAHVFSRTPLLGGRVGAPIGFRRTKHGALAGAMTRVDAGRYLSFVFSIDTLDNFAETGLAGIYGNPDAVTDDIDAEIDNACEAAQKEADFREGLTIVAFCGIGRGVVNIMNKKERPNWRVETTSAPNLLTMSWIPHFTPLFLWRMLDAQARLASLGVELQNVNGLLNMVAWVRSLEGHLVPHGKVPEQFGTGGQPSFMVINQNSLRDLRYDVATRWDVHVVLDVKNRWVQVRKYNNSEFEEDLRQPLYASEERTAGGWLPGVYLTGTRAWWCEIDTAQDAASDLVYERWRMLMVWLARMAPVLDRELKTLPAGAVLWRTRFTGKIDREITENSNVGYADVKDDIAVDADIDARAVILTVGNQFTSAVFHPDNIAERALVDRAIEGFAKLSGKALSQAAHDALLLAIVPDAHARQLHAFRVRNFRDFVRSSLPNSPITIEKDDGAALKLGLGWRVRDRAAGGDIRGKGACTSYLNSVVRLIEDDLCAELQQFNRRAVVDFALRNHESACVERDQWRRTAAAVLALHDDKKAALETMANHDFTLNGVFQATRLLIEIALCECPIEGGCEPDRLDFSRLMAQANLLPGLGGWSDAIRWDAMEPRVRIMPLGDIHANTDFADSIIEPFGRTTSDDRVTEAVKGYAENLKEVNVRASSESVLERAFLDACKDEFGVQLDDMRTFVDFVEDLGIRANQALLHLPKSRLVDVKLGEYTQAPETANTIIEDLIFRPRPHWRDIPAGYDEKDRQPWRFRRRLSVLRKPLIQIDEADDPTVVITPGLLRDGLAYTISNYYRGDFPAWQLKRAMLAWAGSSSDRRGKEFNRAVVAKLRTLGWQAEYEVKITKLLKRGFDQDFGDVDVLAWDKKQNRVLIMECKDLQYRKTYGEIAEQLSDFRGELKPDGKPDDLLRHLDRVDIISRHIDALTEFAGFEVLPRIESHLTFRNPVPVQFALKRMEERIRIHTFEKLEDI